MTYGVYSIQAQRRLLGELEWMYPWINSARTGSARWFLGPVRLTTSISRLSPTWRGPLVARPVQTSDSHHQQRQLIVYLIEEIRLFIGSAEKARPENDGTDCVCTVQSVNRSVSQSVEVFYCLVHYEGLVSVQQTIRKWFHDEIRCQPPATCRRRLSRRRILRQVVPDLCGRQPEMLGCRQLIAWIGGTTRRLMPTERSDRRPMVCVVAL